MLGPMSEGVGMRILHRIASKVFMFKGKRVNSLGSGVLLSKIEFCILFLVPHHLEQIKLLNLPSVVVSSSVK